MGADDQSWRLAPLVRCTAKLYLEHESTNGDNDVHGLFDRSGCTEVCAYDPNGKQLLASEPQARLPVLTTASDFLRDRESLRATEGPQWFTEALQEGGTTP